MTGTKVRSRGSARRWRCSQQGGVDCVVVFGEPTPEQLVPGRSTSALVTRIRAAD